MNTFINQFVLKKHGITQKNQFRNPYQRELITNDLKIFFSTRLYLPLYLTAPAQGYPGISDVITMDPSKALSPFKPELPNHKGSFFPCTCLLVKCLLTPHLCFRQAWITYAILSHRMTKGMNLTMNLFTLFSLRNVQEHLSRLKFYRKCVSG